MKYELTALEELLLESLPKQKPLDKKEAVGRKELAKKLNVSNREISSMIEDLRYYYPICSDRGVKGYWIGNNKDVELFIRQTENHANGLLATAERMREMIGEDNGVLV